MNDSTNIRSYQIPSPALAVTTIWGGKNECASPLKDCDSVTLYLYGSRVPDLHQAHGFCVCAPTQTLNSTQRLQTILTTNNKYDEGNKMFW